MNWSKDRFDKVVTKLTLFLKQSGFKEKNLWFLPASGLSGENLIERKEKALSWFIGPTLIERIGMNVDSIHFIQMRLNLLREKFPNLSAFVFQMFIKARL